MKTSAAIISKTAIICVLTIVNFYTGEILFPYKMLKPTILFVLITLSSATCPKPFNYVEAMIVSFEKNIVPKIEVLLQSKLNIHGISPTASFFPLDCRAEIKSLARTTVMLRRLEYVSNAIVESERYNQSVQAWPLIPLTPEMVRQIKLGLRNAESMMRSDRLRV